MTADLGMYMHAAGKAQEMEHWAECRRQRDALGRSGEEVRGGLGYADPEVYALCDRINALPDICTLQSCCGHILPYPDGEMVERDGHWVENTYTALANLWLWPTSGMSAALRVHIGTLLSLETVESVRALYGRHDPNREVWEVTFYGAESGRMDEATQEIAGFFEWLSGCAPPETVWEAAEYALEVCSRVSRQSANNLLNLSPVIGTLRDALLGAQPAARAVNYRGLAEAHIAALDFGELPSDVRTLIAGNIRHFAHTLAASSGWGFPPRAIPVLGCGAFHWQNGWFFERLANGDVQIRWPGGSVTIPEDSWCSIVHAVGHPAVDFYRFRALHTGRGI